jgi:hypothetical protein
MSQGLKRRWAVRPTWPVLAALAVISVAGDGLAGKETTRVAVLELRAASAQHQATARTLTSALVQGLAQDGGLDVVSSSDLKAMLDLKAQQAILGCEDDKCVYDLAKTLAVDQLVTGEVGSIGGDTLVFVTLLDLKEQRALARTSATLKKGDDVVAGMKQLSIAVTQADAPGADVPLSSLRIALLVDEYKEDGSPIVRRSLEACIGKKLMAQDAAVLNTAGIRNVTGKTGAREILAGGLPDGLTPKDADAVLIAAADYVEKATSQRITKSVNYQVDATFQLVLVASGEVVASDEVTGTAKGYRLNALIKKLAGRACEDVAPALSQALKRRVDRGRRVQLAVENVADAGAADALVQTLKKTPGIGRARLISYADGKAAIDVWAVRGDGVRLGLRLNASGQFDREATEISRDRLRLKVKG